MAQAIITGLNMYLNKIVRAPYMLAKTAILADPNKFKYSIFGQNTLVRQVTGGNASNYSKANGFQNGGKKGSVTWDSFTAPFDRQFNDVVDTIDEFNSILAGFELSGMELLFQNMRNFAAELDATTISSLYSQIPAPNIIPKATVGYGTDAAGIIGTLNKLSGDVYSANVEGPSVCFMRSSIYYGSLRTALVSNMALANPTFVTVTPVNLKGQMTDGLQIKLDVVKFGENLYIVVVPDNRMVNLVTILDGFSAGQTDGGWAPNSGDAGFKNIDLLVVPMQAAALSIRHIVANVSVPYAFESIIGGKMDRQIDALNDVYDGALSLRNIGINQTGDWFDYQSRILYGSVTFSTWKNTMFAVTQ